MAKIRRRHYRLQRIWSDSILLKDGEGMYVASPTEVGTGQAKDEAVPLSEIIRVLNDRFGTAFDEGDALFFEQIKAEAKNDEGIRRTAEANPFDKFQLGIRKSIENLMMNRMADNDSIVTRYMSDPDFQAAVFPILVREIFEAVRRQGPTSGEE